MNKIVTVFLLLFLAFPARAQTLYPTTDFRVTLDSLPDPQLTSTYFIDAQNNLDEVEINGGQRVVFSVWLKNTSDTVIAFIGGQVHFDFNKDALNGGVGVLNVVASDLPGKAPHTGLWLSNPTVHTLSTPGQLRCAAGAAHPFTDNYPIAAGDSILWARMKLVTSAPILNASILQLTNRKLTQPNPIIKYGHYINTSPLEIHAYGTYFEMPTTVSKVIHLITPNGGEILAAGSVHQIKWSSYNISNLTIEYSTDNGTSWIMPPIAAAIPASANMYPWIVPHTISTACKIRILDTAGTPSDMSDSSFSIGEYVTASFPVSAGWNMISIPLMTTDGSAHNLFPTANSPAYGFAGGYYIADTLRMGKGYWLRFPEAATADITGSIFPTSSLALDAGWNLFGIYYASVPVGSITTDPPGIIVSSFFEFDSGYNPVVILERGKGFWVRTSGAGIMNLNVTAEKTDVQFCPIDQSWSRIILSDVNGNTSTLQLGKNLSDIDRYDLPPLPPAGIFDVRFTSNRCVEALNGRHTIAINGAMYPLTLRIEGMNIQVQDEVTGGKLFNKTLSSGESATLDNPAVQSLVICSTAIPTVYQLLQNFPNPFNPTTTLSYQTPKSGMVSLTVYDVLGNEVQTLVNEFQPAGVYTIAFNASHLSGGVYFYSLRAGDFSATKKLILVK